MKKKILIVATLPPPVHGSNVVNQIVTESTRLSVSYSVKVFSLRYATSLGDIGNMNPYKFLVLACYLISLFFVVVRFKPDLVYFVPAVTGTSFYRDCLYAALFKMLKRKVVVHLHGKGIRQACNNNVNRLLYRWFFQNMQIIQLSPLLFNDIEHVALREQVYFLPNGIRSTVCEHDQNVGKENIPTFLYLSNLIVNKGPLVLLKACSILKQSGYEFHVNYVGAEASELTAEKFRNLIQTYQLADYITYWGPQYGEAKEILLARSHIFVFPTYSDCFPLVILEAMEHGLPVISTYEGAIPEIVRHNETGLLVAQQDDLALADAMMAFLNAPESGIKMGVKGRARFLELYTSDRFEEGLLLILEQIIAN